MLVDPISLSGMCFVIAPACRCAVVAYRACLKRRGMVDRLSDGLPRRPGLWSTVPMCSSHAAQPLPCPAELFRVSLLDQGGPPTACRARWRPGAAAAPCLRHRCGGPRPLSAQHRQGGQPEQEATRPARAPGPDRSAPVTTAPCHRPPFRSERSEADLSTVPTYTTPRPEGARPGTYSGSVAEARTGLLEAHVTGARAAHPPLWLTFGG